MEATRVDRLLAEGRMPHVAGLRARGCAGTLQSRPRGFLTMVWPGFFTGTRSPTHGWYYGKMWRPETMRLEFARPDWLAQRVFWDDLCAAGRRVGLLDLPFAPPGPAFRGVYLNGWQCHDDTVKHVAPPEIRGEVARRFGKRRMTAEPFGPQTPARMLELRQEMLEATAQIGEIASWLLTEHRFDLFAMALGTPHRAGHYLFALSEIDAGALDTATRSLLEGALDDVYVACDEALGRVLSAAGPDARIAVFALHGMGPETGWAEQFPRMLAALDDVGAPPATGTGALYRLKRKIPAGLAQRVMSRLPQALGEAVVPLWSRSMYDWSTTRCFPVPGDLGGFLRINLAGREAQGVVQPGRDYRDLCRRLHDDFLGFRRVDSGEPAVAAVDVVDDLVDRTRLADGSCRT